MAKQIIQERCIQCGICLPECPNEGISEVDGEYRIDSSLCTECYGFHEESRCAEVCPADAVETLPATSDEDENLPGLAAQLRPDHFPRD